MSTLNKSALVQHAEHVMGQKFSISEPFSAGQYWACFELVGADDTLVIARVRLPRHPDSSADAINEQSELHSITCEVATMTFLRETVSTVRFPCLYAYAGPGSQWATSAGAIHMLIEGFHGNTFQDVQWDIYELPASTRQHIIKQWTQVQADGPVIGKLSTAPADGLVNHGPFSDAMAYFTEIGQAKVRSARRNPSADESDGFALLGALVFLDILQKTDLFTSPNGGEPFHFNHMDMGTQNILVDDHFNFIAVIDWEFAQTAPWQVNHYPRTIRLLGSDACRDEILNDPTHLAHDNVSKHLAAQTLYRQMFHDAELELEKHGRPLVRSIADLLDGEASRIYACLEDLGQQDELDKESTYQMVWLAYGFDLEKTERYLEKLKASTGWQSPI
ncbi:hypothetical protein MMC07_004810 [Pseudocyphellaria aurata]|nr:hypothetical protein [Pseudocyphellaria aurata]